MIPLLSLFLCLDTTFASYGLEEKVGSSNPPDIAAHVEEEDGVPLTADAYARFLCALGAG